MKKLTKLIFSCAAIAAVTAALSTAALAADLEAGYDISGSYDETTGKLTLSYGDYETAGDETILILNNDVKTTVTADDIEYVDQDASVKEVATLEAGLTEGTYYIRVGGGSTILTGVLKLDAGSGDEPGSDRLLGDVDGNTAFSAADASAVAEHVADLRKLTGEDLQAADADDNGAISGSDAAEIAQYIADMPSNVDGVKTVGDKQNKVAE